MLTIRLSRVGKRKQPYFRLIVCEKQKDPWGTHVEILGTYDPRVKTNSFDLDRVKYWLSKGAQPSETVHNLFVTLNLITSKKINKSHISTKRGAAIAAKKPAPETTKEEPATATE